MSKDVASEQTPYVACPILDQRYTQKTVGPTPFASAKSSNGLYEQPSILAFPGEQYKASKAREGCFEFRMTFPSTHTSTHHPPAPVLGGRDPRSKTEQLTEPFAIDTGFSRIQAPNTFWFAPPATESDEVDVTATNEKLPRYTFHPLLSKLQAAENEKMELFNPACAYLANASRKGPVCDGLQQQPGTPTGARPEAEQDPNNTTMVDKDDPDATINSSRPAKQAGGSNVGKTAAGREYSGEGGFHEPEHYSSNIIEFAKTQQTSLTGIAAKALASAIHRPCHSLPANVAQTRAIRPLPNSGPTGTNVNRYEGTGVSNPNNVIVPPSAAFRNLSPELQATLMERRRDTRSKVKKLVRQSYPLVEPPPANPEPPVNVDDAELEKHEKYMAYLARHAEDLNYDDGPQGDVDNDEEEEGSGAKGFDVELSMGLGLWRTALARKGARKQLDRSTNLPSSHPVKQLIHNRRMVQLTPNFTSVFNNNSTKPHFMSYLSGTGLRMDDSLAQVAPQSISSFLNSRDVIDTTSESHYSTIRDQPCNAFTFDDNRLVMLLNEKGGEVEEVSLEGMRWLTNESLSKIGAFCAALKIINLAQTEVSHGTFARIVQRCPLITFVNVNQCHKLTHESLSLLFMHCAQLTVLSASGLNIPASHSRQVFAHIGKCKQLTALDLSYSHFVDDFALVNVARHCKGLEMLDISGCKNVGDNGVGSVGSCCAALRLWKLQLCDQPALTAKGLSLLSRAPRNLRALDVSGLSQLTPKTFKDIVAGLPCLESLSIAGCLGLNEEAIRAVTMHCLSLEYLDVSSCTDITLDASMDLIHSLKKLKTYVVSESTVSNAQVVMLSAVRENCRIIRNQFRPRPIPTITAYLPIETKKKAPADATKGKGK